MQHPSNLAKLVTNGNVRAIARAISWIEDDDPRASECLGYLYSHIGKAHIIGITGPPGAGKSTLTGALTKELRQRGYKCGLLLVDPSSPFTGGAILGDRIRMSELTNDKGVYIRSMSTRGSLGGLAKATRDAIKVLDAAGKDIVIVETVGIGQAETDVVSATDTVVVVTVPGLGDHIQTLKAGVMEIADVFVVNKADKAGAKRTRLELRMMLDMSGLSSDDRPPILMTTATTSEGVQELADSVRHHYCRLVETGRLEDIRVSRMQTELQELIEHKLYRVAKDYLGEELLASLSESIVAGEKNPYQVVDNIANKLFKKLGVGG